MKTFDELPEQIKNRMLDCQVEQGNERNPDVFRRWIEELLRGFDWGKTKEGREVWADALIRGNYAPFFEFHRQGQSNEEQKAIIEGVFKKQNLTVVYEQDGCVSVTVSNLTDAFEAIRADERAKIQAEIDGLKKQLEEARETIDRLRQSIKRSEAEWRVVMNDFNTLKAEQPTSGMTEADYQRAKAGRPVEVIKAVPYQVCPLCEGFGQIQNDNLNAVGTLYVDCPVCLGSRVIPMYALPNEIITEEE